jgi:tetratricopeptide (TPR) repeat protein
MCVPPTTQDAMHNVPAFPQPQTVTTSTAENTVDNPVENALALHRAGRLDRAEQAYRAILDAQPCDANTLYMLGVLYLQREDIERAIERFDAALALEPHDADCLIDRGIAALVRGDDEGAERFFGQAVEYAPQHALAHSNLGKVRRRMDKREEALASFQRAVELECDLFEAALGRADLLEELSRPHEAVAAYQSNWPRRTCGCCADWA